VLIDLDPKNNKILVKLSANYEREKYVFCETFAVTNKN
jgi:hypothetical protein